MGVTNTGGTGTFGMAVSYRNPQNSFELNWGQPGVSNQSATALSNKFDPDNPPFSLGSGTLVSNVGKYLMPPTEEPIAKFVVVNDGTVDIFAGVNITSSGGWTNAQGFIIPSGQSYEFGGDNSQVIRNVWAKSAGATVRVQGYATNLRNIAVDL